MEGIIIEAVAGFSVKEIMRAILQAVKTVYKFESVLENLRRSAQSVSQNINGIAQHTESESDELQHEIWRLVVLLEKAEELINRCSRIAWWNYFKKYKYSKKLIELDASLRRALIDLLPLIWENITRIQDEINKLNQRLERILQEREAQGVILKRSKSKVIALASGLKKMVQNIPGWILPYLTWFIGIHRRACGYQRIADSFWSHYGKNE